MEKRMGQLRKQGRGSSAEAALKAAVRRLIAVCFLSRIIFFYNAEFGNIVWDEIYWFLNWGILIYFTFLVRHLIKKADLQTNTIRILRAELFKLGLLFASLFLWEILNCINSEIAHSGLTMLFMLLIAASLASWMILSVTSQR